MEKTQPAISSHLAKLRANGLVAYDKHGQWVFYHLKYDNEVLDLLLKYLVHNRTSFPTLEKDRAAYDSVVRGDTKCQHGIGVKNDE